MVRTANLDRPLELLDAIGAYLVKHGLANLSLRPLSKAVGASPRVLLYYFGSKEGLIIKTLAHIREREQADLDRMPNSPGDHPSGINFLAWKYLSSPEFEPHFRLFLEAYSLSLRQPKKFAAYLQHTVRDWLDIIAKPLCAQGYSVREAQDFSTIALATLRGLMLDYFASRDRARLDHAMKFWLQSLDSILQTRAKRARLSKSHD
jgi:AcrR family transcriptional regulator